MNKRCLAPLISILFFYAALTAFADNLVQFPKGNAEWTVTISPLKDTNSAMAPSPTPNKQASPTSALNPPAQNVVKQIEVTQVDKLKRVRLFWSNDKTTEEWTIVGLPVIFKEDPRDGSVFGHHNNSMEAQFAKFSMPYDTSAFAWVTIGNLQEQKPVKYHGVNCFHYADAISTPTFTGSVLAAPAAPGQGQRASNPINVQSDGRKVKREAWISSDTLLPVALATDSSLCLFTFSAQPPAGPLEMPEKFSKEVAYYKKVMCLP